MPDLRRNKICCPIEVRNPLEWGLAIDLLLKESRVCSIDLQIPCKVCLLGWLYAWNP